MLVRSPLLTSHKWYELVSPGRLFCRCNDVILWCYTFVLFCFVFRRYAFIEAAALRPIALRYAGAPIATRAFFLSFCLFRDETFPFVCFVYNIAVFSLYREYVVRLLLPDGVFLLCDHGLDF